MKEKILAIIPARSGSKGLPDKNIKELNGQPLIAYTIKAAQNSGIVDEVHFSTDSQIYADIAIKYGANVPFLRKPELSSDNSSSLDMVEWVLAKYKVLGQTFDTVVLLQPTSPLRDEKSIKGAYELFKLKNADCVISVCEASNNPLWTNTIPTSLSLEGFINNAAHDTPRQLLKKYYTLNGAMYMFKSNFLNNNRNLYQENTYAFIMSRLESVDIDDYMDFVIAEALVKNKDLHE